MNIDTIDVNGLAAEFEQNTKVKSSAVVISNTTSNQNSIQRRVDVALA